MLLPNARKAMESSRLKLDAHARGLLWRFCSDWIWPRWRALVGALVLTGLLAAATAGYPLVVKLCFDALMKGQTGVLPLVLGAVVVVTLTRGILLYLQNVETNRIVMRLTTDIQRRTFVHLAAADYASHMRERPGALVSRLTNDVTFIQQASQAALNTAVRDVLLVAALVVSMVYLDWLMSLVVLVVYPVAAAPIAAVSQRLRQVAKRTQAELGDMTALLTELLSAMRLIKTFRLEGYAAAKVGDSMEEVFRLKMKAVRHRARLDPTLEILGGLAVAGVVGLAYWRIASGISTVGDFMGFVTALLMAAQPIRALGNLSGRVHEGLAAAERIYDLLDERPRVADRPGAGPLKITAGTIAFEAVAFSYPAQPAARALHDFTLTVPGGSTVALVGRSGAGKSTVINLVPRLFDVEDGRIAIDGQDIRDVTLASLRGAIAIVSQEVTLFDDTIAANIGLGRLGAGEAEIVAAAKAAAAHEFILAQPQGYETRIGDRGMRLSGGQRQRLALARAILKDAPILLLDEATSALDSESERAVQDALARFTTNRTTLVIAHRLATVQNADLICMMDGGRIVELGSHAELLAREGAYAALCRTQLIAPAARPAVETTTPPS
ncbi:MAG TPA: ABC transporter ATP-binding protein [Hyphomicrobiaceae bacterium]|nr:ABC transporter ATP-binding protein [Hyphomicrobiaceae bacterium]